MIFRQCLLPDSRTTSMDELDEPENLRLSIFRAFESNDMLRRETMATTLRFMRYRLRPEHYEFLSKSKRYREHLNVMHVLRIDISIIYPLVMSPFFMPTFEDQPLTSSAVTSRQTVATRGKVGHASFVVCVRVSRRNTSSIMTFYQTHQRMSLCLQNWISLHSI